ncbi:MAG TPA: hypothetical protein VF681_12240 [Abditibacteriaceae bacterium]|jgi:hypothetical protein
MKHRFATLALAVSLCSFLGAGAQAAPKKASSKAVKAAKKTPLPRYVSLDTIQTLRKLRGDLAPRLLDPVPPSMPELKDAKEVNIDRIAKESARRAATGVNRKSPRIAQLPRGARGRVAPARIPRPVTPKWVRYPLEFQLGGIGLGTRAVDKDRFNRIDRYGLFAMHGNPTAVVVPVVITGGAGGEGGAGGPGAPAAAGGAGGGAGGASATGQGATDGIRLMNPPTSPLGQQDITIQQTPPLGAQLFPGLQNGELPDWAAAVTVDLDNNHVQWIYNRGTYAMGFVVDRLGYVDAIVMAGVESPIVRTQLEDPVHTVKLGDDLRKVLFRYGYPDNVATYQVHMEAGAGTTAMLPPGGAGGGGGAGGAGAGPNGILVNGAFRTMELRYEQSYNIVFTIRNNRVVRIYIFGDPDFFNDARRQQLRRAY